MYNVLFSFCLWFHNSLWSTYTFPVYYSNWVTKIILTLYMLCSKQILYNNLKIENISHESTLYMSCRLTLKGDTMFLGSKHSLLGTVSIVYSCFVLNNLFCIFRSFQGNDLFSKQNQNYHLIIVWKFVNYWYCLHCMLVSPFVILLS